MFLRFTAARLRRSLANCDVIALRNLFEVGALGGASGEQVGQLSGGFSQNSGLYTGQSKAMIVPKTRAVGRKEGSRSFADPISQDQFHLGTRETRDLMPSDFLRTYALSMCFVSCP
jgi:hypothetical protein